ncbi:MAG: hypothetical protein QM795_00105 [Pseudoxanthomonas sp.]
MSRVKRMGFAMWLALAGIVAPVLARDADADFAAFLARWRAAVAANDADAIARMTQAPFLYEGRGRDREGVARVAVPALMTPEVRRCLRTAVPVREDDRHVLFCAPYLFYFAQVDGQWRWVEFTADGEA